MGKRKTTGDTVLVADDDATTRRMLHHHLTQAGYQVVQAADGQEAIDKMSAEIAVAVLDLRMPKLTGLDCLRLFRKRFPDTPVLITSEFGEIRDAVEAVHLGANTFLEKPVEPERLLGQLRLALQPKRLASENRELRAAVGMPTSGELFVGNGPAAKRLLEFARKVAGNDSTVLLTGESGTGKTTLARLIHRESGRPADRFIAVSCASLPANLIEAMLFGHVRGAFTDAVVDRPGSVEMAEGGTLFLDEIGDLPLELQPKLLTFLQDKSYQRIGDPRTHQVDVRVIAATHQDLEMKVADRSFRADLYYRLNVLPIGMPSLRDRKEDIAPFAGFVLKRLAEKRGGAPASLTAEAVAALERYDWPGNLRELENALERAATFCERNRIDASDLSLKQTPTTPTITLVGIPLEELERRAIVETLRATDGNKRAAARMLGIDEKTVYNKMKRFGIAEPKN